MMLPIPLGLNFKSDPAEALYITALPTVLAASPLAPRTNVEARLCRCSMKTDHIRSMCALDCTSLHLHIGFGGMGAGEVLPSELKPDYADVR